MRYIPGAGIVTNSSTVAKNKANAKKEQKKRQREEKSSIRHALEHLLQPFCVDIGENSRYFVHCLVGKFIISFFKVEKNLLLRLRVRWISFGAFVSLFQA